MSSVLLKAGAYIARKLEQRRQSAEHASAKNLHTHFYALWFQARLVEGAPPPPINFWTVSELNYV